MRRIPCSGLSPDTILTVFISDIFMRDLVGVLYIDVNWLFDHFSLSLLMLSLFCTIFTTVATYTVTNFSTFIGAGISVTNITSFGNS